MLLKATGGRRLFVAGRRVEGDHQSGMADQHTRPNMAALRKLEASLQQDLRERDTIPRAPSVRHAQTRSTASQEGQREIQKEIQKIPARDLSIIRNTRDASLRDGRDGVGHDPQMRDASVRAAQGRNAANRNAPSKANAPSARDLRGNYYWREHVLHWWMRLRKVAYIAGGASACVLFAMLMLWWRLANGPIELDVATPWLAAAIEENFGSSHRVEVGGTQIERDANGRTSLRIRDIVVRDRDGEIVASAPKAEVGVSGSSLMAGRVRAQRLSLVGAEMQVRIETDSKVTVFAGTNKQTFVTASAASTPVTARASVTHPLLTAERTAAVPTTAPSAPTARNVVPDFAAILAWIDSLSATGLDGKDLGEIGLKNGNLTVDDQRNG